ncbi:MAG: tyrosine--tRNA ligase [Bacteroidia bacterium]|nr:tyrosine--tRNA ligase [Bacteroidia bacterium]MDW8159723.1 tyrosine--tRNA ligase [Bacteroidia bacterium]
MSNRFFDEINWRGLVHCYTPEIANHSSSEPIRGYIGFDPTAPSLHIGNLVAIMLLVHLQRTGNIPIVLIGGATGMIGDPSGRSEERVLLDWDTVAQNAENLKQQLTNFLDFSPGPYCAQMVNNLEWLKPITLLDFLRDTGKYLTINYMIAKESVQKRLEAGISFTEFSYQLIQAYDYYYLHQNLGCNLQMGGGDQWGNITAGIELIRKKTGKNVYGLTAPLLTKADGTKFGKSQSGNIWLNSQMTSPYKFYQYWFNLSDEDVLKFLAIFSLKSQNEIREILDAQQQDSSQRIAQKALAEELTVRIHGKQALQKVLEISNILFGNATAETLQNLTSQEIHDLIEGLPQTSLPMEQLQKGLPIVDALAYAAGSKSEARRLLQAGGILVNKQKVNDLQLQLNNSHLLHQQFIMLQIGKKRHHILVFS